VGLAAALEFALIDASEREQRLGLLRDQLWWQGSIEKYLTVIAIELISKIF
jgi:hypothetical protein